MSRQQSLFRPPAPVAPVDLPEDLPPAPPLPAPTQDRYWLKVNDRGTWHTVGTYPRQEAVYQAVARAFSADRTAVELWQTPAQGQVVRSIPCLRIVRTKPEGRLHGLWVRAGQTTQRVAKEAVVWWLLDQRPRGTEELAAAYARHRGLRWVLRGVGVLSPGLLAELEGHEAALVRVAEAVGARLEKVGCSEPCGHPLYVWRLP